MIELVNINKKFGNKVVLKDFSLKIEDTDFIAIVGESGKGKTTLLNIIGLLEQSDSRYNYRRTNESKQKANLTIAT